EKIRELAHQINARRKHELDARALDEVHEENRKLDQLKNRFLPNYGEGNGGPGGGGAGPGGGGGGGGVVWGNEPEALEYSIPEVGIHIGKGVAVPLRWLLGMSVRDATGHPVMATIEWFTSDAHVAAVGRDGVLEARDKGDCQVWARVKGTSIES